MLNILRPLVRSALQCAGALSVSVLSLASAQDIRIAHVYDKTGPLEAYAKQTQIGLMMGLEYATNATPPSHSG